MNNNIISKKIVLDDREIFAIFGKEDENLRLIEKEFPVKLIARGNDVTVSGEKKDADNVIKLFKRMQKVIQSGKEIDRVFLRYEINIIKKGERDIDEDELLEEGIAVPSKKKFIWPRTSGQKKYVEAIKNNDIVFAIGPAGTGKTYLAVASAVNALLSGNVGRIILVRPAVEAGEKLGFLPGTFQEKVDPYLRPLYDALYDMIDVDKLKHYMEIGIIETAPLAYMRGRTLNDAYIILDEAQNTTMEQMKMFLTRLGFDSKAIITGDITQVDLPHERTSGLIHVQDILKDIAGIEFVYFSEKDVVRHKLVQQIIKAYSNDKCKK